MKPKTPPKPPRERPPTDATKATDAELDDVGTNAVEHVPDPNAEPVPDGHHKYIPRSPYNTGNY